MLLSSWLRCWKDEELTPSRTNSWTNVSDIMDSTATLWTYIIHDNIALWHCICVKLVWLYMLLCRSKYQAPPVLGHEELFWFSCWASCQYHEHQQALSGSRSSLWSLLSVSLCIHEHDIQNYHSHCYQDSPCRQPGFSPSKVLLTDPRAISVYEKALQDTMIYRHAESYCRVS